MDCTPLHDQPGLRAKRTICADVVALDQMLVYNRFGSFNPFGMIYALRRDVVPLDQVPARMTADACDDTLGTETTAAELSAGQVRLKDCKRPRPLVLRANVGDLLHVRLTNLLMKGSQPAYTKTAQDRSIGPDISSDFCKGTDRGFEFATIRDGVSDGRNGANGSPLCNGPADQAEGGIGDGGSGDWPDTRGLNFAVQGLLPVAPKGQSVDQACLGLTAIAPGASVDCYYHIEREGPFFITSTAAPSGGEGDGGSITHGLFGAIMAEQKDSEWFRSQVTRAAFRTVWPEGAVPHSITGSDELPSYRTKLDGVPVLSILQDIAPQTYEIIHSDLNAIVVSDIGTDGMPGPDSVAFREFSVFFHDELKSFFTRNFEELEKYGQLAGARDGFAINYGASGMGTLVLANRKQIGPAADCTECLYEEFFLTSWANGDPALLEHFPDDPSNVHHSYLNDRVVFRNFHAGPKETHVFHLHAHQWFAGNDPGRGAFLDSQTVGPQQAFTYNIDGGRLGDGSAGGGWLQSLGSGNRNRTVGDSIFHCHLYPHFAQGMWELWRVHDVLEDGSRKLPDGQWQPGFSLEKAADLTRRRPGSVDHLTGRRISVKGDQNRLGTPIPAIVPLPVQAWPVLPTYPDRSAEMDPQTGAVAQNGDAPAEIDTFPGYPFFVAGQPGHRPPQAPMDIARKIAADTGALLDDYLDGGLPRHVMLAGSSRALPFDLDPAVADKIATGTTLERETAQSQVIAKALALGDMTMKLEKANLKLLDYDGTPMERAAMRFHATGTQDGTPEGTPMVLKTATGEAAVQSRGVYRGNSAGASDPGYAVNGAAPKPGAPFADPCGRPAGLTGAAGGLGPALADPLTHGAGGAPLWWPTPGLIGFRRYEASAVQVDLVTNRAGWHDPQGRINVLSKNALNYKDRTAERIDRATPLVSADETPFFFRALSGECIEFRHRNELPYILELDDFQVRTPTDTIGQHIHLVKFDVTASDGSANGWNYEDGTFAPDEIAHRICAAKAFAAGSVTADRQPGELAIRELDGLCGPDGHVSRDFADRIWRLAPGVDYPGQDPDRPFALTAGQYEKLFQTTVQRWFADPILSATGDGGQHDRTLRTVFSHDHFGASSIQQHGFYTALVIEPQEAKICEADGTTCAEQRLASDAAPMRLINASDGDTGTHKKITDRNALKNDRQDYQEYALAVADFALLYDPRDRTGGSMAQLSAAVADAALWQRDMRSDHGQGMARLFCEGSHAGDFAQLAAICGDTPAEDGRPAPVPAWVAAGRPGDSLTPPAQHLSALLKSSEIAVANADATDRHAAFSLGDHLIRWRRMAAGYAPDDATAPLARPVAPPARPESISVDHHDPYLINYRGEPLPLRLGTNSADSPDCALQKVESWVGKLKTGVREDCEISTVRGDWRGNAAYVFTSDTQPESEADGHGDPATPIIRADDREKVMIRLIQGAQEVQHAFTIDGYTFARNLDQRYPSTMPPLHDDMPDGTLALACIRAQSMRQGRAVEYPLWQKQGSAAFADPATRNFWRSYENLIASCFNAEGRVATQEIGISEHFEFSAAFRFNHRGVPEIAAISALTVAQGKQGSDTLLHFGSTDAVWNGAWTLVRVNPDPGTSRPSPQSGVDRGPGILRQGRLNAPAVTGQTTGQPQFRIPDVTIRENTAMSCDGLDDATGKPRQVVHAALVALANRNVGLNSGAGQGVFDPNGLFLAQIDPRLLVKGKIPAMVNTADLDALSTAPSAWNHLTVGDLTAIVAKTYHRPEPPVVNLRAGECLNLIVINAMQGQNELLPPELGDARMPAITSLNVDPHWQARDAGAVPTDYLASAIGAAELRASNRLAVSIPLPHMGKMSAMPLPYGNNTGWTLAGVTGSTDGITLSPRDGSFDSDAQATAFQIYAGQALLIRDETTGQDHERFIPYAFGALPIGSYGDFIQHAAHGLAGTVVVLPQDAQIADGRIRRLSVENDIVLSPDPAQPDMPMWVTTFKTAGPAAALAPTGNHLRPPRRPHLIRQFTLLWQDGLNLHDPDTRDRFLLNGTQVAGTDLIENCIVCSDSYDFGNAAISYRGDPFHIRLRNANRHPEIGSNLNSQDFGDRFFLPKTTETDPLRAPMPILPVQAGEEITLHVVHPGGRARQRAFVTIAQDYDDLFHGFGFPRAALLAPGKAVTAQFLRRASAGCYLFFDGPTTLRAGGAWGLIDVQSGGNTACVGGR